MRVRCKEVFVLLDQLDPTGLMKVVSLTNEISFYKWFSGSLNSLEQICFSMLYISVTGEKDINQESKSNVQD